MDTELPDPEPLLFFTNQVVSLDVLNIFLQGVILFFLLILSGLVSGSEVAFFSLNETQKKTLTNSHKKGLVKAIGLLKTPKKLLATILILNNFINVSIITLSAYFTWGVFGKSTFVFLFLTVVVTLVIVFFGEVIPKLYANKNKVFFVKLSFPLINVFYFLFRPLVLLLVMISKTFKTNKKVLLESSKDEINKAMSLTIDKTTPDEEKNILEGIINFGAIKVKEIMKSRIDVVAFDVGSPFINIANQINTSGYSRIPVFKETIDNIEGVLYVKDLIPHLNNPEFDWTNKIRPAFFVPENKNIDMLFKDFQEKRVHLAIVIDEYGGVSGIVTLEDVIEEIVGDIKDEFDFEKGFEYKKTDNNTYLFEGKVLLNNFCKILGENKTLFDDVKGEGDSLGGLLLEINSKIPKKGDKIKFGNFIFTIMSVDKKRIERVRVYKKPKN